MSKAVELFNLGYTDLVCVTPPGAEISPRSALKPESMGKAPGKHGVDGWYGYNFVGDPPPDLKEVTRWGMWRANIGLMARRFPAIDIDVRSKKLRDFVIALANKMLGGPAPHRLSRDPRALLMYRCDEPFQRMALAITHKGESHLIEVLAGDRQYLIAGTHPSGRPYEWAGPGLPAPELLTLVTREKMLGFLQALRDALVARGLDCDLIGTGELRTAAAPPQEALAAPSIDELRELVEQLPNDENVAPTWESWIEVGHAIKAAAAGQEPAGELIWLEWTSRCTRVAPADPDEASGQYARMRAPHRVGWGWLQELADQHSDYCSAQVDFADYTSDAPQAPQEASVRPLPSLLNDEDIVQWLIDDLRPRVRYAAKAKVWYVWNGHVWEQDDSEARLVIREALRSLTARMRARADTMPGKQGLPYSRAADLFQQGSRIRTIVEMLEDPLKCHPAAFDLDHWLINSPGGVVDLRTGELRPVTPEGMFARSLAVAPRRGPHPLWDHFLTDLTGGDDELRDYLQRMFGYMLTGSVGEKCLWFVYGAQSDTGKSTFLNTVRRLFGTYGDSVQAEVFLSSRNDRIPAELARLPGARLVTVQEPEHGRVWNEQQVKTITGDDPIHARYLYGQWITYDAQFKVMFAGNNEPEVRNLDEAMLRRLHIIPADRKVPPERRIADLARRMVDEEGPAILQWMLDGCLMWQREGLGMPAAVQASTLDYAETEDSMGSWLKEECELVEEAESTRQGLYVAYSAWARARGEDAGKQKQFKRKMLPLVRKHGLQDIQVGGRRLHGYRGIRLRSAVEDGTELDQ